MTRKILLSGYYGFNNAGDEAVLSALVKLLRGNLPDIEIVALSAAPNETAERLNIRAIDRWNKQALKRELDGAALFGSGGGSLLQDVTSVRSVYFYTSQIMQARRQHVPAIVLAQGLGPLKTAPGRWLAKRALKQCRFLSWRDAGSMQLAAELGLGALPNYQVCDPVLLWEQESVSWEQESVSDGPTAAVYPNRVVLALRPWPGLDLAEAARLVRQLKAAGREVVLLPFYCKADGSGEDEKLAAELNERLGADAVQVLHPQTPEEAMREIARAGFLLGMRLHSLIMAAARGVPAAAISYDPKVTAFAQAEGIPLIPGGVKFRADAAAQAVTAGIGKRPADRREAWEAAWQPVLTEIEKIIR